VPTFKKARRFGVVFYLILFSLGFLWLASNAVIDEFVPDGYLQTICRIVAFVAFSLLLIKVGLGRLKSFKCQNCGAPLGRMKAAAVAPALKPEHVPDNAILRYCQKCDIIWDTGVRNNSN